MPVHTGAYISGMGHALLIAWALLGGLFLRASDPLPVATVEATILTREEFEAMFSSSEPVLEVEPVVQPPPPVIEEPASPPAPEPAAADVEPATSAPETREPDPAPDAPPMPEAAPEAAPRVAPEPVPAPPDNAETGPEVVPSVEASPEAAEPVPEQPATAPEEATTEIVTEAEKPASAAPSASPRPTARPTQLAAVSQPETEPAPAPTENAVADALAEALSTPDPTPAPSPAPTGPPLSSGEKDALRVAVQRCWNVGSLSSEALATTVTVFVRMAEDGKPDTGSIKLLNWDGGSEAAANKAFEAARRAIIRCGSSGFDLPREKYSHWREIEMIFNPEKMRVK